MIHGLGDFFRPMKKGGGPMKWRSPHMDPEVIQHHTEVIQASEIRAQAIPLKDEVKVLPCLQALDQDAGRWIVNSIPYHSEQNHLTKTCVKVCPQLIEKKERKITFMFFTSKRATFTIEKTSKLQKKTHVKHWRGFPNVIRMGSEWDPWDPPSGNLMEPQPSWSERAKCAVCSARSKGEQ